MAALAGKQHGVVARWQLLDAGITARQIRLRLTSGRLHEIHRGVYLVGHTVRPPLATEQAALLACGKQATLSHRSAANLWDLLPYPAGHEVDLLWRDAGVVVELDGWDGHSGRIAFERDPLKVAHLTAQGLSVVPVTGRQLREDDPAGILDRLRRALAARTPTPSTGEFGPP
ncbi:MAG: type IV toxin-antitoxin system AbiEi family antitoxin domain-containing protein [Solirubrobacterales bacterium]